jgi:hypothetical protein
VRSVGRVMSDDNDLGEFGYSSESDAECCRGCAQKSGHKADCSFSGQGEAVVVPAFDGKEEAEPGDDE